MAHELSPVIIKNVVDAIAEDVAGGDLTAELLPRDAMAHAEIKCRDDCVLAGEPWASEVFRQVDQSLTVTWHASDGDAVSADSIICSIDGNARSILTAERTALNFLQLLSAVATSSKQHVDAVAGTNCRILDTRKTIPGLRTAQKYAVRMGGAVNHRVGLYDAILIKENHIASAGGIREILAAVPEDTPASVVEIEVESLEDLRTALEAGAKRIMLDNFSLEETTEAVRVNREEFSSSAELEASGGKTLEDLKATAQTGVDYISVGALTKHIQAVDLSMLVELVD